MKFILVGVHMGLIYLTIGTNLLNGECVIEPVFDFPTGYECLIPGGKLTFDGSSLATHSDCGIKWSTATSITGKRALFQADGNLVIHDSLTADSPVFASFTFQRAKKLIQKDDGNLVLVDRNNNTIWQTGPFDDCKCTELSTQLPCQEYNYNPYDRPLWKWIVNADRPSNN